MAVADALIGELEQEAATTRRVLERVPEDKLSWKPHDKSMSLGQLAQRVAQIPTFVAGLAAQNPGALPENFEQAAATSVDDVMMETGSLTAGDKTLMSMPRIGLLRALMLNQLVSPSRPALGLSAVARRAGAIDLRTERRREPVRLGSAQEQVPVLGRRGARLLRKRPCGTRFLCTRFRASARNELARRDEGAYRRHSTNEQRRQAGWIGVRKWVVILARALSSPR